MTKLYVVNGLMMGETFEITAPVTILGRAADSNVVVTDDKVSRHHCRIVVENDSLILEDLGSSNGTYVNGRSVTKTRLVDGDEIRVGNHIFALMMAKDVQDNDSVSIVSEESPVKGTTVEVVMPNDTADFLEKELAKEQSPERMIRDLGIIYRVGGVINGIRHQDELLSAILDLAFDAVNAERGFLVLSEQSGRLIVKARRFKNPKDRRRLSVSKTIAEMVFEKGQAVLINDALHDQRFSNHASIITHHLRSVLAVPLRYQDKVLGFIFLDNPSVTDAFSGDDLRLVAGIAIQAGIAIENSRLFKAIEDLMFGAIGALVAAVEAKDRYIKGHSERVARICRTIGEEMNLPYETMKVVHLAALLHDIGKIGIRESILNKEGHLTDDEKSVVREHAGRGAEILRNIHDMADVVKAVKHHHEYFNGEGYPTGIAGKDIPIASRIIAVADAYDAMTSDRPYRGRLTQETCLSEIVRCSGIQFDPEVVEALLRSVRKSKMGNTFAQAS